MSRGKDIADLGAAVTLIEELVNKMGGTMSYGFGIEATRPEFNHNYAEIRMKAIFHPDALREFLGKEVENVV